MISSHGTSGSRGVCVAFRYDLEYKLLSSEIVDKDGRFIILLTEIQESPYIILNYYGRNDKCSQLKVIRLLAEKMKTNKC